MSLINYDALCVSCSVRRGDLHTHATWTRGLCGRCYYICKRDGTLDQTGLPPRTEVHNKGMRLHAIGERYLDNDGYVRIVLEDGTSRVEHRVVMEKILGRKLVPGENVHHKNRCRDDNAPENLELWYKPQLPGARVSDLITYLVAQHRESLELALLTSSELQPQ
jgi:HNH endonuclease